MKTQHIFLFGGIGAAILLLLSAATSKAAAAISYLNIPDLPRGIRNNNPGNLVITSEPWKGKIPTAQNTDGHFEQFETFAYGTRALIKNMQTDISRGTNTIEKLITDNSPPSENDTAAYIQKVADATGIVKDAVISASDYNTMKEITQAVGVMENGVDYISNDVFATAWAMI